MTTRLSERTPDPACKAMDDLGCTLYMVMAATINEEHDGLFEGDSCAIEVQSEVCACFRYGTHV